MRGCICKNEREEILLVGRKTSDRVGIRRGGFRVADTHTRTRACMFAQWMRKTSFSSLLDSVNFKILLKNPFLFLRSFFFFSSSIFLPRTHYRMQTIRQPMETRKYCPSPLSLLSSQSVSKITLPSCSKNVFLPSLWFGSSLVASSFYTGSLLLTRCLFSWIVSAEIWIPALVLVLI